jgi:hypothetical protein
MMYWRANPLIYWHFLESGAGSRLAPHLGMKRIIGMSLAAVIVIVQLAGFAVWRVEPATYLAPIDGPGLLHEHA